MYLFSKLKDEIHSNIALIASKKHDPSLLRLSIKYECHPNSLHQDTCIALDAFVESDYVECE
jgi:hypothetical protein